MLYDKINPKYLSLYELQIFFIYFHILKMLYDFFIVNTFKN